MKNEDSINNSASSELNFIDQWSNVTVLKEISNGTILRQHKAKRSNYKDVYDTLNYDEPSTSKSNQMYSVIRKPVCIKARKIKKTKSLKRCPMRIAELAVPTKRQCIETWRSKATVIPNFMVERLKQRVMDQKPIVLIADAVNCFERSKRKPRKRIKKKQSFAENTRLMELKILCAIFGYKIALKLRRPMNVSLNYRLSKINTIVKEEIDAILRYKKSSSNKHIRNKEILEEVSRKVTAWIDTVLDESECKLLEENLLELEEEEGPVLDFIDDLVDEVMTICVPPSLVKSREKFSEYDLSSDLSKNKITEEVITGITDINSNEFIRDLYTKALENANQQILEKHEDYLVPVQTSSIQQSVDLLSIDSGSEHVLENVREELNKLVDQIAGSIITDDAQFHDQTYITDEENAMQPNYELEENTNNLIQSSEDSVQEHNINEGPNITVKSETSSIDLKHKEDDPINNELKMEITENNEIVKEIIKDLLQTGVWYSEPIVLNNDMKTNDTEVIFKRESIIGNQLNIENIQNETVGSDNHSNEVEENFIEIKDVENDELSVSIKVGDAKEIVEDLLNGMIDNSALEIAHDENETNEDNKKVKFSTIDMGIGVNKNLLTKLSAQQLILQKPSSDYLNLNIDFAPPNENLLSNADESWPQNIALPIIKVTESVNKSVTSLGKIFEVDEKRISSESSYISAQNSEVLIDVQLTSMSKGNSKMNDTPLAQFQNENKIIKSAGKRDKKSNDKPQRKEINKKQVKSERNVSEMKYDLKPRAIDKNKPNDPNGRIRDKSVEVHKKPENKYIKTTKNKEKPKKENRLLSGDKILNKADRIKVSDNKRGIAKNKINENRIAIKQRKHLEPVVSNKKQELIKNPFEAISKEDRGDGIKNEQKQVTYSCEKICPSEQITKLKENGVIKIDAYDILKWCKGLENVIENLETWNSWINSTCKCIRNLKQKDSYNSLKSIEKTGMKWKTLQRNIKQDTILWRDMKQRNRDGLKSYKKYYLDIKNGATKFQVCDCSNN